MSEHPHFTTLNWLNLLLGLLIARPNVLNILSASNSFKKAVCDSIFFKKMTRKLNVNGFLITAQQPTWQNIFLSGCLLWDAPSTLLLNAWLALGMNISELAPWHESHTHLLRPIIWNRKQMLKPNLPTRLYTKQSRPTRRSVARLVATRLTVKP